MLLFLVIWSIISTIGIVAFGIFGFLKLTKIQKEMDSNFIKSQTSYDEIYDSLTKFTEDIRKIYEIWNNSDHLRELSEELRLYIEHLDNLNQNQLYHGDTHLQSLLIEAKNLMETISDFLKMVNPSDVQ